MTTPSQGGWGKPVTGGTALRIPALTSPNFNLNNPTSSPSPSWGLLQSGILYAFGIVLSGGTITGPDYIINTSGIFIYSGTPANGNLIGSWAGAAGTDGFGNAYPQGFNITKGAISGSTFTGTDFTLNSSGAFFYSGTPAVGNLVASISNINGTDSFGNKFYSGVNAYLASGGVSPTAIAQVAIGASFQLGLPAAFGNTPTQTPSQLSLNAEGVVLLDSGSTGVADSDANITLVSKNAGAGASAVIFNSVDSARMNSNSGAAYSMYSTRAFASGQTVSSVTFVTLTGMSIALDIGTWFFRTRVFLNANSSAGQWQIEITAPGGTTGINYSFKWESAAGVSGLNVNRTGFSQAQGGPNPSVAGAYWATIEGVCTLSAAGSLVVHGLTTVSADTWQVMTGSYIEAFAV